MQDIVVFEPDKRRKYERFYNCGCLRPRFFKYSDRVIKNYVYYSEPVKIK